MYRTGESPRFYIPHCIPAASVALCKDAPDTLNQTKRAGQIQFDHCRPLPPLPFGLEQSVGGIQIVCTLPSWTARCSATAAVVSVKVCHGLHLDKAIPLNSFSIAEPTVWGKFGMVPLAGTRFGSYTMIDSNHSGGSCPI